MTSAAPARKMTNRSPFFALIVGAAASIGSFLAARLAPEQFFGICLASWLFFWNLALGSLALVIIDHLSGVVWGLIVRRPLEAQMRTLPLVSLFFIPLALGRSYVFPWSVSETATARPHAGFRADYFAPPFVWGRALACFAIWIILAGLLAAWSRQEDLRGGARPAWKCQTLSGPGLVLYGITLHFASIDWIMALEPSFTSTIFAPIVAASQLLSAFALACIALFRTAQSPESKEVISGPALLDLGNLLFTLVAAWAYLVWCQFMLIWIGDLPHDNIWWLARNHGLAKWTGCALVCLGFGVPFFLLLFRGIKQRPRLLAAIAALVLAMQFVFVLYQVRPALPVSSWANAWIELLVPIALGGLWLASWLWLFGNRPILPLHDRNRAHASYLQLPEHAETEREEALAHG